MQENSSIHSSFVLNVCPAALSHHWHLADWNLITSFLSWSGRRLDIVCSNSPSTKVLSPYSLTWMFELRGGEWCMFKPLTRRYSSNRWYKGAKRAKSYPLWGKRVESEVRIVLSEWISDGYSSSCSYTWWQPPGCSSKQTLLLITPVSLSPSFSLSLSWRSKIFQLKSRNNTQ